MSRGYGETKLPDAVRQRRIEIDSLLNRVAPRGQLIDDKGNQKKSRQQRHLIIHIPLDHEGIDEIGYDEKTGRELIVISEKYFRPAEVEELLGDSSKAKEELGWEPKNDFDELVREMVENDCK